MLQLIGLVLKKHTLTELLEVYDLIIHGRTGPFTCIQWHQHCYDNK